MSTAYENAQSTPSPWGPRIPVQIDKDAGLMIAGDAKRPIDMGQDVQLALSSYLSMVYELRSMTSGIVSLRVEDITSLANAFEMEETEIGERLARLMHCDDFQTRRFVQMIKRGRVLVPVSMVAAGALIAVTLSFTGPGSKPSPNVQTQTRSAVEIVEPTTAVRSGAPVVDIGDAAVVERGTSTNADVDSSNDTGVVDSNVASGSDSDVVVLGQTVDNTIQIGEGIHVSRNDGMGE